MEIFHASKTFANFLKDSYQFQGLKGLTSCYYVRIICLFRNHLRTHCIRNEVYYGLISF